MIKNVCLVVLLLLCFSCGKQDSSYIPNVAVNFRAPLNDPNLAALHTTGGAVIVNGYGVKGLILYRSASGGYAAYDRCSSFNPEKQCAVNLDNPTLTVTDPCSGAKFQLEDGTPVKAPATRALKSYNVSTTQYEIIVFN
jgi:nitrite reductase/ring-hydroxylating ferredoxin subunit